MAQAGELPAHPLWENAPPIGRRPVQLFDRTPVPLSAHDGYDFSIKSRGRQIGELFRASPGVYVVSERLLDLLGVLDSEFGAFVRANFRVAESGASPSYFAVMPTRVLDSIDVEKSDFVLERQETIPGSTVYITLPVFKRAAIHPSINAPTFHDRYYAHWIWREDIVNAAVSSGVRGLRAVPLFGGGVIPAVNV